MFGRIRVPGSPTYNALLLPDAAIGTEQIRKFVLVVGDDNTAVQKYVTLGPLSDDNLRIIKDGIKAGDRVDRQRPDARAAGPEGHAAGAGREPSRRRPARRPRRSEAQHRHADFAFLHRPADLCRRRLDRDRDPRRGRLHAAAGRAISGDRAAGHQRVGPISRRQRRGRRLDRGRADRGADQRRREHALRVVELQRRRPLLDRRDVRSRHQSRYRPGAGAEPRRHRAAAPAGGRAQHRRHRRQGVVRPDDGRAHAVARQVARRAVHLQLRRARGQGRADARSGRRLDRRCSAAATIRCGSGSTPTACNRSA